MGLINTLRSKVRCKKKTMKFTSNVIIKKYKKMGTSIWSLQAKMSKYKTKKVEKYGRERPLIVCSLFN